MRATILRNNVSFINILKCVIFIITTKFFKLNQRFKIEFLEMFFSNHNLQTANREKHLSNINMQLKPEVKSKVKSKVKLKFHMCFQLNILVPNPLYLTNIKRQKLSFVKLLLWLYF